MLLLIDDILGLLSPHICKGCGSVGATYCRCCIFNTIKRNDHICLYCRQPAEHNNVCDSCCKKYHLFDDVIAIGPRKGSLKLLVGDYKYNSELASCRPIAELLAAKIAVENVDKYLTKSGIKRVIFNVFKDEDYHLYTKKFLGTGDF